MTRPLALLTLLALALPAWATPPTLKIADEVKADPGDWVTVSPETTAKTVVYVGLDGLKAFPSAELKDPRKLILGIPESARGRKFRFVAVGTLNDEVSQQPFVVAVSGDAPPPGPAPGPNPPPGPADPLLAPLSAAYAAEPAADRGKALDALARFWAGQAVADVKAGGTAAQLFSRLRADEQVAFTQAGADAASLPGVRAGAHAGLKAILPADPAAAVTAAQQKDAQDYFARLAKLAAQIVR